MQVLEESEIICMHESSDMCNSCTLQPVLFSAPGYLALALKYDLGQQLKCNILS